MRCSAILWCAAFVLGACSDVSDNFSWVVVSNPGGSFGGSSGGAVIVIRKVDNAASVNDATARMISVSGTDTDGGVVVHLATQSDVAALERAGGVTLGSPVLPRREVELRGARLSRPSTGALALSIDVLDTSDVDDVGQGPGRLHVAATGTVLVLEHQGGVVVFGRTAAPELFPFGTVLDTTGERPVLLTPDQRLEVLYEPPHPRPDQRVVGAENGGTRLLGPRGEVLALLPSDRVQLQGGASGLFLTASFPEGLSEDDPVPMSLLMAHHNRYLLRVDRAGAR